MEPVAQVSGLTKIFDGKTVVNDLSFTVQKGDVYGFLGQNGAGKSTTIRMLLGLITPSSGDIRIFSHTIKNKLEILKRTGALIERPDMYKYLNAYEHMWIFSKLSGIRPQRDRIMQQLEMVDLHNRSKDKVKTFSQGMKQRLGIAVSLVHDPDLIILDEPTNGLDPQGIADMRHLIKKLSKDHQKTIIISSHLLSEIEQIATSMLIIHKGKKIIEGSVSDLLDPADTIVQIDALNQDILKNNLIKNGYQLVDAESIRIKMNRQSVPALIEKLSREGVQLTGVQARHSLEDYFISLTNQQN